MRRAAPLIAVTFLWLGWSAAFAHVTVNPKEADAGATVTLTFRVPNEHDTAGTIGIEVNLPTDPALPSVEPRAKAGWTHSTEPTKVTWTGGRIAPDRSDEFQIVAGPLPSTTEQLVFKVLQTYDNGDVVRWIEVAQPGAAEPDHPAAVLKIVGGVAPTSTAATSPSTTASEAPPAGMPAPPLHGERSTPVGLIVIIVVGAVLVAGAIVFGVRRLRASR